MKTLYVGLGATHIGRRKNNQDSDVASNELGLFVVADGMGGYASSPHTVDFRPSVSQFAASLA